MTTATVPASPTALESRPRPWGFLLIQGVAMVVIGGILLFAELATKTDVYLLLVKLLGIYWIISGVLDLVHMFGDHRGWGWKLLMGLISIAAGTYVVSAPIAAGVALPMIFVLVLGISGLMQGIMALILAFKGGGWGLGALGVVGIIFGLILIFNWSSPGMALTMVWVAAVWAFIGGFFVIYRALQQRKAQA